MKFPDFIEKLPQGEGPMAGSLAFVLQAEKHQAVFLRLENDISVLEHSYAAQWEIPVEGTAEVNIGGQTKVYGPGQPQPDEILQMDKYFDLPTIEDYFSELLGSVNVRNTGGRKVFRFNSARAEMLIYDPLVLIDWVAVNDINKILAMPPRQIARIELINAPYIKGSIIYGGIISFISKNNDFAGIDLPSSGTFINYAFLQDCQPPVDFTGQLPANMPDSRNTVFWEPDLKFNDEGAATISFQAPEMPGTYIILLRARSGA